MMILNVLLFTLQCSSFDIIIWQSGVIEWSNQKCMEKEIGRSYNDKLIFN